jgi:hypothetical protein
VPVQKQLRESFPKEVVGEFTLSLSLLCQPGETPGRGTWGSKGTEQHKSNKYYVLSQCPVCSRSGNGTQRWKPDGHTKGAAFILPKGLRDTEPQLPINFSFHTKVTALTSVNLALGSLRQDHELKASLGYIVRLSQTNKVIGILCRNIRKHR